MNKSTHHSFDIDLAEQYGVYEAIIIHHMQHWVNHNKRLGKNFKDGRTWTYQTRKEIAAWFPYMSDDQVRRFTDRLVDLKVLRKGNYNKKQFDKTIWYAFEIEEMFTIGKSANGAGKSANGAGKSAKPIPDTKPDTKTEISKDISICQTSLEISKDLHKSIISWKGKLNKASTPEKWAPDIEKMISRDGYTQEKITSVIAWLSDGDDDSALFWRPNILSGKKLREKFDTLEAKMRSIVKKEKVNRASHEFSSYIIKAAQAFKQFCCNPEARFIIKYEEMSLMFGIKGDMEKIRYGSPKFNEEASFSMLESFLRKAGVICHR